MRKISTSHIISKIDLDFAKTYKAQSNFVNSGKLWDACIETVQDPILMNHIILCNDSMKIPPVKIFLTVNTDIKVVQSAEEKQAIGAFWGFVFKFVLDYKSQKEGNEINIKGVKEATRFYETVDTVSVI